MTKSEYTEHNKGRRQYILNNAISIYNIPPKITRCEQKVRWMLLPSAIQQKGRDLQYGKRRVEPY